MEACYGGTDVMERSCAVARGIDINTMFLLHPHRKIRWQPLAAIRIHLLPSYLLQFNNEPFLLPTERPHANG